MKLEPIPHPTLFSVPTVRGPIVLSPMGADITRGRLFLIPLFWCVKYAETHLIWSTGTLTIEINLVMLWTSRSRPASPTRKLRDRTTLCYAGVHEPAPSHTHLPKIVCAASTKGSEHTSNPCPNGHPYQHLTWAEPILGNLATHP